VGNNDLLSRYLANHEGGNAWLGVLTDLKNRGVRNILIACIVSGQYE